MTEAAEVGIDLLHVGAFSGSAHSLREALSALGPVRALDVLPLSRTVSLLPSRVRAVREARGAGDGVPWTKTATWSAAVQSHVAKRGFLTASRPLLVVQTLPALVLGPEVPYVVYTDRVSLEGAAIGGPHGSRFAPLWLEREIAFLRRAARVFVMGPSTKRALVDRYGLRPSDVRVVGAGPNARLGSAKPRSRCRRLLFVGTQWELKGGPELLEAFSRLRRSRPELELVLVGSSPGTDLPDGVSTIGRVPHGEMDQVYDEGDLLVIPTHMEAFGIALVEALIKGLPCVCSDIGNQPWIVGDAGLTVAPGNVDLLADSLEHVIEHYPEFHGRALARGAELGRRMSWTQVAETIVEDLRGHRHADSAPA